MTHNENRSAPSAPPVYLGVSRDDIADSLRRACDLVADKTHGTALALRMEEWLVNQPQDDIAEAQSSTDLVRIMRESGTRAHFLAMEPFFRYYALHPAAAEDMRVLYRDLARWGAFTDVLGVTQESVREDTDLFLIRACIFDALKPAGQERLTGLMQDLTMRKKQGRAAYIAADGPALSWATERIVGALVGGENLFWLCLQEEMPERGLMLRVLMHMAGIDDKAAVPDAEGPYRRYMLMLPSLRPSHGFDTVARQITALRSIFNKATAPHIRSDDIQDARIDFLRDGAGKRAGHDNPYGFMMEATPRAAQAIADALPRLRIIDAGQQRVTPRPV